MGAAVLRLLLLSLLIEVAFPLVAVGEALVELVAAGAEVFGVLLAAILHKKVGIFRQKTCFKLNFIPKHLICCILHGHLV